MPELSENSDGGVAPALIYPPVYCGKCRYCIDGDRPMCMAMCFISQHLDGAMGEYVAVPSALVHAVPAHLTWAEANCLPTAYLTAWRATVVKAGVRLGDAVLIPGIGSGVSLAMLQFVHLSGEGGAPS